MGGDKAQQTVESEFGAVRSSSTVAGGTAMSTTVAFIPLILGATWLSLTTRNFATGVVVEFAVNPWLTVFKAEAQRWTEADLVGQPGAALDLSRNAQDADAGTDVDLSALAATHFLYVGSHVPFRGVDIDVDAVNGTASVLTVRFWNGTSWADISDTDGTASGGATMAQDGTVAWTVPTTWAPTTLADTGEDAADGERAGIAAQKMFWTRWEVSVALDAATTLNAMLSMNQSTARAELIENANFPMSVTVGPGGAGCVEALINAGTGNLIVNCATNRQHGFA